LHLVGSSVLLYLIDDARSNKNQTGLFCNFVTGTALVWRHYWIFRHTHKFAPIMKYYLHSVRVSDC